MYVAGVASAVEARTPTTVASILCVEEGMDSVTLIKSDAETRQRPIRAPTDHHSLHTQVRPASIFCVQKFSRFCRSRT